MNHVMIDIETLGVEPGCSILSIAAARFDPMTGEIEDSLYLQINPVTNYGLCNNSISTIVWWMQQNADVQQKAIAGQIPLYTALVSLSGFITSVDKVWANSPSFDCAILRYAFKINSLTRPWEHWNERDVRTAKEYAALKGTLPVKDEKLAHDAMYDVLYQIRCVVASMK